MFDLQTKDCEHLYSMSAQSKNEYRTLLLCKVTVRNDIDHTENSHRKVYANLYSGSIETAERKPEKYITLGGFDALSIYTTYEDIACGIEDQSKNRKWLRAVLMDRKKVLEQPQRDISYHPIHLVREKHTTVRTNCDASFLFVIFVYGVSEPEQFDSDIRNRLDNVEIYECINISDRVILYYTDNIGDALVKIDTIEATKRVRKIYTTISIPLDGGSINSNALAILKNQQKKLKDAEGKDYGFLSINIRGSIRNPEIWARIAKELPIIPTYFCNCGEDDFIITADVCGNDLTELLGYFMTHSNEISNACWDIHTELQIRRACGDINGYHRQDETQEILESEYNIFENYIKRLNDLECDVADWVYVYKELFTVQRNLDRHPLLKGSAYMVYDCLHIANEYFIASVYEDKSIFDVKPDALRKISRYNQHRIERFVRCLGQITDQLTRNDDVIFHGIGRIPAIAATLPENLLEFYHAFLRLIAEYLIKIDSEMNVTQSGLEYAFLLSPELNQRMRVSELFDFSYDEQDEKCKNEKMPWPLKQVYVIQLPADDVFWPCDCFFALTHECFHKFGETLRCRKDRRNYMTAFIAASVVAALGVDSDRKKNLFEAIFKDLMNKIDPQDLYMQTLEKNLSDALKKLISEEGIINLAKKLGAYYLYFEEISDRLKIAQNAHWLHSDINMDIGAIDDCAYFFRECYADFMTIVTLGVKPEEYLHSFRMELKNWRRDEPDGWKGVPAFIQRISVVLATCTFCYQATSDHNEWEKDNVCSLLMNTNIRSRCGSFNNLDILEIIKSFYTSLLNDEEKPVVLKHFQNEKEKTSSSPQLARGVGFYPVAALSYVMDYLKCVYAQEKIIAQRDTTRKLKENLSNIFEEILRSEHTFGKRFHDIVCNNRRQIETRAGCNKQV